MTKRGSAVSFFFVLIFKAAAAVFLKKLKYNILFSEKKSASHMFFVS